MKKLFLILILLIQVLFFACESPASSDTCIASITSIEATNLLQVHFIDVGQGDCTLVISPAGSTMLIDAGLNKEFENVMNYLSAMDVDKIDILVITHPDLDHIGSIDEIINTFKSFYRIYMPLYAKETKAFRYIVEAILDNDLQIVPALGGYFIPFDPAVNLEIVSPNRLYYDDANNYSVVILLRYGNIRFLFTGDAEVEVEEEMLSLGYDLDVDLLKLGHHGSKGSSSFEFLLATSPEYAVASAGESNRYGHPAKETLDKLEQLNIKLFRTDQMGNILAISDGATITFITGPLDEIENELKTSGW